MHTSSGVFSILGSKPQKTMHFCEAARANFRHRVATKSLTKSRFFGSKRCVHAVVQTQGPINTGCGFVRGARRFRLWMHHAVWVPACAGTTDAASIFSLRFASF